MALILVATPSVCSAAEAKVTDKSKETDLEKRFKTLDANKDGVLVLDEFVNAKVQADTDQKAVFKQADQDGDRKLSLAEFKKAAAKTPDQPAVQKKQVKRSGGLRNFLRRIPIIPMTEKVEVTLTDGKMTVTPKTVPPANQVIFIVTNKSKTEHHFVGVVTGFPPDKLPVKDGRVRYFTYFDEPHKLSFRDGGGWSEQCARGHEPKWGSHRKEPGVKIAAGKKVEYGVSYSYDARFPPGSSIVVFCNQRPPAEPVV